MLCFVSSHAVVICNLHDVLRIAYCVRNTWLYLLSTPPGAGACCDSQTSKYQNVC